MQQRATYDHPVFIAFNLWRLYAGWWDQNPSHLQPAKDAELGRELAALIGGASDAGCGCSAKAAGTAAGGAGTATATVKGVGALLMRAQQLASTGSFDLACALLEV